MGETPVGPLEELRLLCSAEPNWARIIEVLYQVSWDLTCLEYITGHLLRKGMDTELALLALARSGHWNEMFQWRHNPLWFDLVKANFGERAAEFIRDWESLLDVFGAFDLLLSEEIPRARTILARFLNEVVGLCVQVHGTSCLLTTFEDPGRTSWVYHRFPSNLDDLMPSSGASQEEAVWRFMKNLQDATSIYVPQYGRQGSATWNPEKRQWY